MNHREFLDSNKQEESITSGIFNSDRAVDNDYSTKLAQLEVEINQLNERAKWIYKTAIISNLSVLLLAFTMSSDKTHVSGSDLMVLSLIHGSLIPFAWHYDYLNASERWLLLSWCFIETCVFTAVLATTAMSIQTETQINVEWLTAIAMIITAIEIYRTFGLYIGRKTKRLQQRLQTLTSLEVCF